MDWSICALCQCDGNNLIVPSANLNPDVCGYSVLARNIDAFTNEGLPLPKKIQGRIQRGAKVARDTVRFS